MSKCLWCNQRIVPTYSFFEIMFYDAAKGSVCDYCRKKTEGLGGHTVCDGCGRGQEEPTFCADCLQWKEIYPDYPFKNRALFTYNSFAKEYMERFKMMGDCEMADLFSYELKQAFKEWNKKTIIIPIPLSNRSQKSRGFNQTELLLQKASIPYNDLLENNGDQKKEVKNNQKGSIDTGQPFRLRSEAEKIILGKEILIVDDIYTTGRPLFHAADLLRSLKPSKVETFTLFR